MRLALLAAGLVALAAPAFASNPALGEWVTADGSSRVRIEPCPSASSQLCGVVSWLTPAKRAYVDRNNPDAALRHRPILGLTTVSGFSETAPGRWGGGRLYDPASGKSYKGRLSANPDGTLKVEGCVLMLCQAQTWTRP